MTEHLYGDDMSAEELTRFLHEQGVGVLSLTNDGEAYGVPLSYGYDEDGHRCILELGYANDSKKRKFLETTATPCLTIYEWHTPLDWKSAILTGRIRKLADEVDDGDLGPIDAATTFHTFAKAVSATEHSQALQDVEFSLWEFEIENATGRYGMEASL